MKDEIREILPELSRYVHQLILKANNREKLSLKEKQLVGDAALSLNSYIGGNFVLPHEKVLIERAFMSAHHILYDEQSLFYFSSFYYLYQKMKKEDMFEKQTQLIKTNLDTMAMLMKITAVEKKLTHLGSSTDNYFFTRMERCIWGLRYILKANDRELYVPSLYNICNMHQTLILYINSGHSQFDSYVEKNIRELQILLSEYLKNEEIRRITASNKQLKLFIDSQLYLFHQLSGEEYSFSFSNDEMDSLDNIQKLRVLTSLFIIRKDLFITAFEYSIDDLLEKFDHMNDQQKVLLLRVIVNYLVTTNYQEILELDLFEPFEEIDIYDYMSHIYKGYSKLATADVTDEDLEKLNSYNDQELRDRVSSIIVGADPAEIARESRKPHGSFEISDMEIRTKYKGKRIYLCMPFKTGQEIKSGSVPVDVSYQIVRPFIEFHKCVVVFISAKKTSQNLSNYIKKLQDKLGWPIGVLEERELAYLLKINGCLL